MSSIFYISESLFYESAFAQEIDCAQTLTHSIDLSGCNLNASNFKNLVLNGIILSNADLSDSDFTNAVLGNADLRGSILTAVMMRDVNLDGAILIEADLTNASVTGTASLTNADLSKSILRNTDFTSADLRNAVLRDADLRDAKFVRVDLTNADLRGVDMNGNTSFNGATLTNANLRGVDITDVDFRGAKLQGADLREVKKDGKYVQSFDFIGKTDDTTKFSDPDSGCLIATAAYGTELAPQVQLLREIRDNTLFSTTSGTSFMLGFNTLYYSFAPTVADLERENPMFKETVKILIAPMISTLSIMSLANEGSEVEVLGLGISVIALNLGMYIAAPALIGFKVHKHIQSKNL